MYTIFTIVDSFMHLKTGSLCTLILKLAQSGDMKIQGSSRSSISLILPFPRLRAWLLQGPSLADAN